MFIDEAVALGRLNLPDYEERRLEYLSAEWIGDKLGGIDELKSANAAKVRMEIGLNSLAEERLRL